MVATKFSVWKCLTLPDLNMKKFLYYQQFVEAIVGGVFTVQGQICKLALLYKFFLLFLLIFFSEFQNSQYFSSYGQSNLRVCMQLLGGYNVWKLITSIPNFPKVPWILELETLYLDSGFLIKFINFFSDGILNFKKLLKKSRIF